MTKEQIWKSKCLEEVEKNVDLMFIVESLEKELNELEQSVSGWKRRYEELDLQHQDTLRDLFDATNGETPSHMASDITRESHVHIHPLHRKRAHHG